MKKLVIFIICLFISNSYIYSADQEFGPKIEYEFLCNLSEVELDNYLDDIGKMDMWDRYEKISDIIGKSVKSNNLFLLKKALEFCKEGESISNCIKNFSRLSVIRDALNDAIYYGCVNIDIAKYLISQSTNISMGDKWNRTALHYACLAGNLDKIKLLVDNGANINAMSKKMATPLYTALSFYNKNISKEIVTFLLDNGANPCLLSNGVDEGFGSPSYSQVHWAWHKPEIVQLLIDRKIDVNFRDGDGKTPLIIACACYEDNLESVKSLLNTGANIISVDNDGKDAFWYACKRDNLKLIKYLLMNYSKVLHTNNDLFKYSLTSQQKLLKHIIINPELYPDLELNKLNLYIGDETLCLQYKIIHNQFLLIGVDLGNYCNLFGIKEDYGRPDQNVFDEIKPIIVSLIKELSFDKIRDSYNKKLRMLQFFFSENQIYNLIVELIDLKIPEEKLKEFLLLVSKEFNLTDITDKSGNNLLPAIIKNYGYTDLLWKLIIKNPALLCQRNDNWELCCDEYIGTIIKLMSEKFTWPNLEN